jgi:hypothetical protein
MTRHFKSRENDRNYAKSNEHEFVGTLRTLRKAVPLSDFKFNYPFELVFDSAKFSNNWDLVATKDKRLNLISELMGEVLFNNDLNVYIHKQHGDIIPLGQLKHVMIESEDLDRIMDICA